MIFDFQDTQVFLLFLLFLPSSFVSVSCCRVSVCLRSFFHCRCQTMCEKLLLSLWGQTPFSFCNLDHPLLSEFRDRACYGSSSSFSSCRNVGRAFGFNSPFRDFESFVQRELHAGASQIHRVHILILYDAAAMNKSNSSEAYGRRQHFFSAVIFVSLSSDSDSF
jgi:hypothetical protein